MALGSLQNVCLSHWQEIAAKLQGHGASRPVDGKSLDLATVVAVARYGLSVQISEQSIEAVIKSADMVQASIARGEVVYGVNTGFGGSANTRTNAVEELQKNLLRMLQFGVVSGPRPIKPVQEASHDEGLNSLIHDSALPLDDPVAATSMPESWVRASMLIRLNSLASGFSGVQENTIRTLQKILEVGITPQVPLKGSISASGDLSPLSYVGGVISGKPGLNVWTRNANGERSLKRADVALAEKGIQPVTLGAKEGLALVNGTAFSCAVGSLALHDALGQAYLAQALTAMTVEALCGTDESFDKFFAEVRPHPGQVESAQNIRAFLEKSQLVQHSDNAEEGELRQDRYAVRTASQWIGPVLEDLHLAYQQIAIEMNSTTDNPLIDPSQGGKMLHGGNFQARAVTSAMEKTRQSLQTIGRMLFAQCTELINPATNNGLPPNLVAEEPSQSFIWKGTDIMVAALQAELGFLANPVGSHVQTAEMGNQAINSLALISGRYTLEAVQTLSQLAAAHLVAVLQALDIRAMNVRFLESLLPAWSTLIDEMLLPHLQATISSSVLQSELWAAFRKSLESLTHFDSPKRFSTAVESLQPLVLKFVTPSADAILALQSWTEECTSKALEIFLRQRDAYFMYPDATPYIGEASARIYRFVRNEVGVPFIGNENITSPRGEIDEFDWGRAGSEQDARKGATMGGMITKVYEAMRTGVLYHVVMDCVSDVAQELDSVQIKSLPVDGVRDIWPAYARSTFADRSNSSDSDSTSGDDKGKIFTPAQGSSSKVTTIVDPLDDYKIDFIKREDESKES
ncbi:putative phenylalanine ammonia-lyase [Truncatella angustata]|uniref:Phenylalanine ammonia-lyase n=1 Tax=Truncatella angustata TaxID=152316 RepID=A0A9P9A0W4_9PEZI|nr:putative phenylalanine ammonia-lyase [Truncatella angustata]KAH6658876.1 putative phenylalanine ammonia-lyase [Truncatella angustata]KAH8197200.1 hypothetical protein TruAng_008617 [Truncatella angustata]